ncbi:MAG: cell envelope integrity protein TolA [Methylococcales bacterium]|nr:cell envelope integrity protein TolA [Methylococcales bacterium]
MTELPGATIPATRLQNILENLKQGRALSEHALMYLQQHGLTALQQLAQGEITYEAFCKTTSEEQAKREQAAEAKRQKEEAAWLRRIEEDKVQEAIRNAKYERDRQRAEEARRQRESDPKYIAKMKNQQLRMRYGLDRFIEKQFFARLMDILHRLDGGNRLSDEDILWLTTEGEDYYTEILQAAFHEREAEFYTIEYKRTSDPWNAVNASGHYRKCNQAKKAHNLLTSIPAGRQKAPKLNSAICTTHGGVMRDLNRFDEALKFGSQAHDLTPKDFRPCTLLGAVNFEVGNYDIGRDWYVKATDRGASERSIDYDLRGIFLRADKAKREEIRAFLLREDSERYKWVRNLKIQDHVSA